MTTPPSDKRYTKDPLKEPTEQDLVQRLTMPGPYSLTIARELPSGELHVIQSAGMGNHHITPLSSYRPAYRSGITSLHEAGRLKPTGHTFRENGKTFKLMEFE